MVLALIVYEPVGIIHPVSFRREVKLRAIRLLLGWLELGTSRIRFEQRGCKCHDA